MLQPEMCQTVANILDIQKEIEKLKWERSTAIKDETDAIEELDKCAKELFNTAAEKAQPFDMKIKKNEEKAQVLKGTLSLHMATQDKKTQKIGGGIVAARTTVTTTVVDKAKAVHALVHLDKVDEGVGSLKLAYLRKIRELDIIDDAVVILTPNTTVTVKEKDTNDATD